MAYRVCVSGGVNRGRVCYQEGYPVMFIHILGAELKGQKVYCMNYLKNTLCVAIIYSPCQNSQMFTAYIHMFMSVVASFPLTGYRKGNKLILTFESTRLLFISRHDSYRQFPSSGLTNPPPPPLLKR